MEEFRPKPWLTPAQQVEHLESEGISFELTSMMPSSTLRPITISFALIYSERGFLGIWAG